MSEEIKKIYTPQKRGTVSDIIVTPSVKHLMDDALSIISTEIMQFKSIVNKGKSLDMRQAKILQGYIKSLVELSRESREHADDKDFANMTDEELIKMVESLKAKQKTKE
jgi:hypothetical protein